MEEKQQHERGNVAGLLFWKEKSFKVGFERVQRGFLLRRKGKVILCRAFENGKYLYINILIKKSFWNNASETGCPGGRAGQTNDLRAYVHQDHDAASVFMWTQNISLATCWFPHPKTCSMLSLVYPSINMEWKINKQMKLITLNKQGT